MKLYVVGLAVALVLVVEGRHFYRSEHAHGRELNTAHDKAVDEAEALVQHRNAQGFFFPWSLDHARGKKDGTKAPQGTFLTSRLWGTITVTNNPPSRDIYRQEGQWNKRI